MEKERFKGFCLEILPLIAGIIEAVKKNGYEGMSRLAMADDGYFSFSFHDNDWSMTRLGEGPVRIHYEYNEEIQLKDQLQGEKAYSKVSENLVEISLVYASLQAEHEDLSGVDSITWKQMFVEWANEFEMKQLRTDWDQHDYLECIEEFARHKILEYAGLES